MTFEDLIAQGIRDTLEEKCAEYCVEEKSLRFSLAYKIRLRSMIRSRTKSTPLSVRKIKLIIIAVILALFALTGFSLWRQFGGFSFNIFQDHSRVSYSGDTAKITIEEIYGLPEGYELLNVSTDKNEVVSQYMFDGEIISLNQHLISNANNVNTENKNIEYISISGNDGYYIRGIVDEYNYLVWIMDGYQFNLTSKLDKKSVVLLANLLKTRNFDKIQ